MYDAVDKNGVGGVSLLIAFISCTSPEASSSMQGSVIKNDFDEFR